MYSPQAAAQAKQMSAFLRKLEYDKIRYGRSTCAQKLTRWPAYLNLAYGTEAQKKRSLRYCQSKEASIQWSHH